MKGRKRILIGMVWLVGVHIACLGRIDAMAGENCQCRYFGHYVPVGECICMLRPNSSSGPERTCCVMALDVTSWSFSGKACPIAMAKPSATADLASSSGFDDGSIVRLYACLRPPETKLR